MTRMKFVSCESPSAQDPFPFPSLLARFPFNFYCFYVLNPVPLVRHLVSLLSYNLRVIGTMFTSTGSRGLCKYSLKSSCRVQYIRSCCHSFRLKPRHWHDLYPSFIALNTFRLCSWFQTGSVDIVYKVDGREIARSWGNATWHTDSNQITWESAWTFLEIPINTSKEHQFNTDSLLLM